MRRPRVDTYLLVRWILESVIEGFHGSCLVSVPVLPDADETIDEYKSRGNGRRNSHDSEACTVSWGFIFEKD